MLDQPNGNPRPRIAFVTMGCAKNEVDTATMKKRLEEARYIIDDDVDAADAIVVNTCSFIQSATEESLDVIFELSELSSVRKGQVPIVVAGCMPARYGADLESELEEASAFVPCSREDDIVEVLDSCLGVDHALFAMTAGRQDRHAQSGVYAYVKISDGCDRWCSYCTIPLIRGRYHSFDYETIRENVAFNIANGAREIVLIAQDTGRWGQDFEEPSSLAWLLDTLASEFADTWFRIMYLEPEGVTEELLEAMRANCNVCNYLDIPLQHVNPDMLKRMNRAGSFAEFEDLVCRIRSTIPEMTLRTTLIAGFPGESEEAFEEMCEFVEAGHFDYVGVFPYSREEGTRAYELPCQLDEEEKMERAQRVRDLADAVSSARIAERIGSTLDVLVEGREEDGQLYGRAMSQAPEVDGVTYLACGEIGEIARVRIVDTLFYEMEGE